MSRSSGSKMVDGILGSAYNLLIEVRFSESPLTSFGVLELLGNLDEGFGWPLGAHEALDNMSLIRALLEPIIVD